MKLAVFHDLPAGGALRTLHDKLGVFRKNGWAVHLFSFSTAEHAFMPLSALCQSVHIEPLDFHGSGRFKRYFSATKNVAERIDQSGADLVFVEKCRFFGSPPILRQLRKPAVFYTHEPRRTAVYERLAPGPSGQSAAGRSPADVIFKIRNISASVRMHAEDKKAIRAAKKVMTNSSFTRAWLRRAYGVDARVVYQGVDAQRFFPDLSVQKKDVVLSVGRVDATKGYDFVVRSLGLIPKFSRPGLLIIGDSFDAKTLESVKREAAEREVQVEFRSLVDESALVRAYQESRLVLCASFHEPFGLSALEAMACGTPVLAVSEGGFLETLVDGKTGYFLQRKESVWAENIQELISPEKKALRDEMGAAGREHVLKNWTWDLFFRRFEAALI